MTLDAQRRDTLLKTLRGQSVRRAMKAIAELRTADDPTLETLGHTATRDDVEAVQALEALWSRSGEPFLVTHEPVDESTLDWRDRLLAEGKGIAPDRIKARIGYRPTGLLDREVLSTALERIRARG